ncbi:MAG: histidine triad nucleotide-binding protein [Candidatus Firestonebacteria bacterium]|nr:histidine triad nucleotide-binding protein [Candidatus Firestonebacteria bacterium]
MPRDPECLFCRIIAGEIPSKKVYEDAEVFAFEDIRPQAPVHLLIVPKEHIPTVADVPAGWPVMGRLVETANRLAKEKELIFGYRVVINCRADAGQEVFHLHLHLLGGRKFSWPPG